MKTLLSSFVVILTILGQLSRAQISDQLVEYPEVRSVKMADGYMILEKPSLRSKVVKEVTTPEEVNLAAHLDTPDGRFYLSDWSIARRRKGEGYFWMFAVQNSHNPETAAPPPIAGNIDISDLPTFSLPTYVREIPVAPSGDDFHEEDPADGERTLDKKDYATQLAISVNYYLALRNGSNWSHETQVDTYNALYVIGNAFAHLGDLDQAEVAWTWYAKVSEICRGLGDRRGGVIPINHLADFYKTIGNSAKEMRLRKLVLQIARDYYEADPLAFTDLDAPTAAAVGFIKRAILDFSSSGNKDELELYLSFLDLASATIRLGSKEESEEIVSALHEVIAVMNLILEDTNEQIFDQSYYDLALRVITEWELLRGNADEAKRLADILMGNLVTRLNLYSNPKAVVAELGLLRARANLESGDPSAAIAELVEIMPDLSFEDALPGRLLLLAAYLDIGDKEKARLAADELEALQTDRTRQVLAFSSEEQRIRFMKELRPGFTWLALDDHLGLARISARFKGLIFEASLEEAASHQRSTDPEVRALQEELEKAKQAAHVFKRMLDGDPETISDGLPAQYNQALGDVDRIEGKLARRIDSAGLVRNALKASPEELLNGLPADRCLIDFVQVDRYTGRNRFAPAYVAVFYHANKIEVRDCGEAGPINAEVHRLRNLISSMKGSDEELTRGLSALKQSLLGSWTSQIPAGTTLLISPDGELNFLPFAALLDEGGKTLFERYDLGIVTSARDAARPIKPWQFQSALLVGNPDYERQIDEATTTLPKRLSDLRLKHSVELRASSLDGIQFEPLPGAEREVRTLAEGFNTRGISTTVLTDAEATEEAFRNAKTADLIHVATHGGILPEARTGGEQDLVVGQMSSGIVTFAGANATLHAWSQGQATDSVRDGIISADEFASMDLGGVRAMVLSACDTALGASQPGEGVMGLRRGLHQAGVANLVTTLWPISDEATVAVMESLYRRCESPSISPLKALGDSQRELYSGWRSEFGLSRALYQVAPFMMSIAKGREEPRL